MHRKIENCIRILNCIFVIIGVIIGAGFASGKEIYSFFYIYGKKGIIGIIISAIIIGSVIYKNLKIIKKYNIETYDELLEKMIKKSNSKTIDYKIVINLIINIFLLVSFYVMCAGGVAYFKQEYNIKEIYSSIAIAIISYKILEKNIKGIFLLNTVLIPIIIITLIILGIKGNTGIGEFQNTLNSNKWFVEAILYASYNCITLTSILIPIKKYIKTKKDIAKISGITTIIIIILAIIIMTLLLNITIDINKIQLPAVYASRFNR